MQLYEGTISEFNRDTLQNKIADQIAVGYQKYYGKNVAPSERRAWQQSLNFLKNSFDYTGLADDKLVIEYDAPITFVTSGGGRATTLILRQDDDVTGRPVD